MSLVPLSLRAVVSIASCASTRHDPSIRRLESASFCCGLQSPACLASLSCLGGAPELACRPDTLTRLTALSSLTPPDTWRDQKQRDLKHAHAFASMYSFHI